MALSYLSFFIYIIVFRQFVFLQAILLRSWLSLQPQRVSPPSSAVVILLLLLRRLACWQDEPHFSTRCPLPRWCLRYLVLPACVPFFVSDLCVCVCDEWMCVSFYKLHRMSNVRLLSSFHFPDLFFLHYQFVMIVPLLQFLLYNSSAWCVPWRSTSILT